MSGDPRIVELDAARDAEERSLLNVFSPLLWQDKPLPQRRYIWDGWLPYRNVGLLTGDGGLGKSLLCIGLQVATALGVDFLGHKTERVKSLGLFFEDELDELQRRTGDWAKHFNNDYCDLENMAIMSRVGEESLMATVKSGVIRPTALYDAVLKEAKRGGYQLIVIDTCSDVFGGNENYRTEVKQFVNLMRRLAVSIDGAVLLTAHPSQSGINSGTGTSGSTGWHGNVRTRMYLRSPSSNLEGEVPKNERVLSHRKSNYGAISDDIELVWKNGVFVRPESDEGTVFVSIRQRKADKAFLECLDARTATHQPTSLTRNSGNYGPRVMLGMAPANGFKQRDLESAMNRLLERGEIENEEYGRRSDPRYRLKRKETENGD